MSHTGFFVCHQVVTNSSNSGNFHEFSTQKILSMYESHWIFCLSPSGENSPKNAGSSLNTFMYLNPYYQE
jgi:hypothetical protein